MEWALKRGYKVSCMRCHTEFIYDDVYFDVRERIEASKD